MACQEVSLEACETAACRQAWVADRFEADPAAITARVLATEDGVVRLDLALFIARSWPAHGDAVCTGLGTVADRRRCLSVLHRPHLWVDTPPLGLVGDVLEPGGEPAPAPLPGPDSPPNLIVYLSLQSDVVGSRVAPDLGGCDGADAHCLYASAIVAARSGRLQAVRQRCGAIEEQVWVDECFFSAAETVFGGQTPPERAPEAIGPAIALCREAGGFQDHCLLHHAQETAALVSRPQPAGPSWGPTRETLAVAATVLSDRDPQLAALFVDYTWSLAVWHALGQRGEARGALLRQLPPRAKGHLHAAVAWQRVARTRPGDARLDDVVDDVVGTIHRARAGEEGAREAKDPPRPARLWSRVEQDGLKVNVIHFLGQASRAWVPDDRGDIAICVLEASARLFNDPSSLFEAGAAHPSAEVRWTAARLSGGLD